MHRILFASILILSTFRLSACSCVSLDKKKHIKKAIERSSYILIGKASQLTGWEKGVTNDSLASKLKSFNNESASPNATLQVLTVYKGLKEPTVEIEQKITSCMQLFQLNETYLILGRKRDDGSIETNRCQVLHFDTESKSIKKILRQLNKERAS